MMSRDRGSRLACILALCGLLLLAGCLASGPSSSGTEQPASAWRVVDNGAGPAHVHGDQLTLQPAPAIDAAQARAATAVLDTRPPLNDYAYSLRLQTLILADNAAPPAVRLLVRYSLPTAGYYYVSPSPAGLELGKFDGTRRLPLLTSATPATVTGEAHAYRVEADGSTLRVFVDGELWMLYDDPQPILTGGAGIAVEGVQALVSAASLTSLQSPSTPVTAHVGLSRTEAPAAAPLPTAEPAELASAAGADQSQVQGLVIWGSPGPLTPASLTGPEVAIALAAGSAHNLAADAAGHVWAWGANGFGQLGDGTTTARTNPIQVPELEGVIAVAAGDDHSLALLADGSVRAWGANAAGQLGDGTSQDQARPVVVQGLEHVRSLAAGHAFSLALQTDGTVWAWGANEAGQLGDGSNTPSGLPVRVRGLEGVEMIAAGAYFGLARKADGSVWAWGADEYGQLGQGTPSPGRNAPVPVARLSRITTIAAGSYHALAVDASGTVWAWGANWFDELGGSFDETCVHAGQQHPCSSVARPVGGLERPIARVAAGEFHSLGLASDGTVWAWGRNADGELGDGTRESSRVPVQVRGLAGEAAIAAGGRHSLAARPPQAAPSSDPATPSELANDRP